MVKESTPPKRNLAAEPAVSKQHSAREPKPPASQARDLNVADSRFVISATNNAGLVSLEAWPQIAVAGASNVGKSSLLNALLGRKGLVRTSKSPGCTRLLNVFGVSFGTQPLYFVDLPGYGYAARSKSERREWGESIDSYLSESPELALVLILIDSRRGIGPFEDQLIDWLQTQARSMEIVVTKLDKLPKARQKPTTAALKKELKARAEPMALSPIPLVGTSSATGEGIPNLRSRCLRAALTHLTTPPSSGVVTATEAHA